jgi:peptide chain release factor 1
LQNKNKAFALLRAKLYELEKEKRHDAEADLRRSQIGTGDRSEKIRTYNFPQSRVTDHRIHYTTHNIGGVMNGDLDELIEALRTSDREAKLLKMDEAK